LNNRLKARTLFYIFLFLLGYGLFEIISSLVYYTESGVVFSWNEKFVSRLPIYLTWILFIPFIYAFVIKYRIEKPDVLSKIILIGLFGILIASLHRIIAVTIVELLQGLFLSTPIDLKELLITKKYFLFAYMFDSYLMYWMIVAVIFTFDYYRKFNENRLIASQLQSKLSLAELNMLKMQIHPHFLFNTLNTISALVHKNPDDADKMISRLSDLLRTSLDYSGKHFVTLREEMEFLNLYLEIQKVRFKERLKVVINIDPTSLNIEVPAIILQPIVENSIKHVLDKSKVVCEIKIASSLNNNLLTLEVVDNGPGILDVNYINKDGVGLSNVKSRLSQIYSNEQSLKIKNLEEGGLLVSIEIPIQQHRELE
jgi:two-component system, LytTR family, sensor kinase